ncbi:MAG: hypothetical protein NC095_04290 [Muribaculum sp.]|nr:hypothetical protein [Muribaculum sp.]
MMEQEQKNEQEEARKIALKTEAYRDGLGHLQLKLGMIDLNMPIEEQLKELSNYHKVPDVEAVKRGETQLSKGYINDFFEEQVSKYFQDFPHAYEVLGKKSENPLENYAALGIKYYLLRGENKDEELRRQSIQAYYDYLVRYEEWLLKHIHNDKDYSLTVSTPEGYEAYYDLFFKHKSIIDKYNGPLDSGKLINETMRDLFPLIKTLKERGLSDYLFELAVTNMIVGKFQAFGYFLIHMAKGGQVILQTVLPNATEPLGVDGIYSKLCQVESELEMTDEQKKTVADVKSGLEALRKKYGNSSNGGCFGTLLLLLSAGASGLAMMFAFIL